MGVYKLECLLHETAKVQMGIGQPFIVLPDRGWNIEMMHPEKLSLRRAMFGYTKPDGEVIHGEFDLNEEEHSEGLKKTSVSPLKRRELCCRSARISSSKMNTRLSF